MKSDKGNLFSLVTLGKGTVTLSKSIFRVLAWGLGLSRRFYITQQFWSRCNPTHHCVRSSLYCKVWQVLRTVWNLFLRDKLPLWLAPSRTSDFSYVQSIWKLLKFRISLPTLGLRDGICLKETLVYWWCGCVFDWTVQADACLNYSSKELCIWIVQKGMLTQRLPGVWVPVLLLGFFVCLFYYFFCTASHWVELAK